MIRVAFLRAVNVGRRTVKMAHLVEIVRGLGYGDVWTHINSGNVVFEATGTRSALETDLEGAFEAELGFETTTFVRTGRSCGARWRASPSGWWRATPTS